MLVARTAFVLIAAVPAASLAQDRYPDVRVAYADLDLRSPAGVLVLDRRLERAAHQACPSAEGTADMALLSAAQRCVRDKLAEIKPARDRAIASRSISTVLAIRR